MSLSYFRKSDSRVKQDGTPGLILQEQFTCFNIYKIL